MSIMVMSHRGKEFDAVIKKAEADLRVLLAMPDTHEVLFLQGGELGESGEEGEEEESIQSLPGGEAGLEGGTAEMAGVGRWPRRGRGSRAGARPKGRGKGFGLLARRRWEREVVAAMAADRRRRELPLDDQLLLVENSSRSRASPG
ncbi:hypothetical protein E2562_007786 [Oryza meyeriana var. granulata]|uniref:Uncharacterized protein n=1 Tax=Oryza meyeriana var. granulata TaxID=110450 RepID=A0A6G1EHR8_9ORYZ|nr:hypothetical protein E2562_007786 [Oryza meyeriana var. granulata]